MREPDGDKLNALMGRLVGDLGASMTAALIVLGDRLGLFGAMADGAAMTVELMQIHTRKASVGYTEYRLTVCL